MTSSARCGDSPDEKDTFPGSVGAGLPGMQAEKFASIADVMGNAIEYCSSAPVPDPNQTLVRIWGPVLEGDALACGAPMGAASVLLRVEVCPDVLARFRALIPDHVKSQPGDTKEMLVQRLSSSDWLDVINFKWKGHGRGGRTTKSK